MIRWNYANSCIAITQQGLRLRLCLSAHAAQSYKMPASCKISLDVVQNFDGKGYRALQIKGREKLTYGPELVKKAAACAEFPLLHGSLAKSAPLTPRL